MKKYPLAVLLMIVSMIAGLFMGQMKAPDTNGYTRWVVDEANVFSASTEREIARYNMEMDDSYDSILAVGTVSSLQGNANYGLQLRQTLGLSENDMLLLIAVDTRSWTLTCGGNMGEVGTALTAKFQEHLGARFGNGDFDAEILDIYENLDDWYSSSIPLTFEGFIGHVANFLAVPFLILLVLLNLVWILPVLIVILTIQDNNRYTQYITRWAAVAEPPEPFRPLLFWHKPGSAWYQKRQKKPVNR